MNRGKPNLDAGFSLRDAGCRMPASRVDLYQAGNFSVKRICGDFAG